MPTCPAPGCATPTWRGQAAGALLGGADLSSADLTGVDLTDVVLDGARLFGCTLSPAQRAAAMACGATLER